MELLFSTPHGSRLYGLAHADSDFDRFEVYGWDKARGKQTIEGKDDVTRTSIDSFLRYCDRGAPQYLEAMFSKQATVDAIPYIRANYHPDMRKVRRKYTSAIIDFWTRGTEAKSLKTRRHALRLLLNLRDMEAFGRFDPTLHPDDAAMITDDAITLKELPEL